MEYLSLIMGFVGSIGAFFAIWAFRRTESTGRRIRIEAKSIIDSSHSFLEEINSAVERTQKNYFNQEETEKSIKSLASSVMAFNTLVGLQKTYASFNHTLTTHLLSLDKKLAKEWIKSQPDEIKKDWRMNLQIR